MARTALTTYPTTRAGLTLAPTAVGSELQWKFTNTGTELLLIKNGSGAGITATIAIPKLIDGKAVASLTVSVAAGAEALVGPFPKEVYNQTDNMVYIDLSSATSVNLECVQMGSLAY
jgi:hypothetical protein